MQNKRSPLTQYVYDYLNRRVLDGTFRDGALPTENRLMAELKVSKTTIRQAQQRLIAEGKIVKLQGKGTFVADFVPSGAARQELYVVANYRTQVAGLELWQTVYQAVVDQLDYRRFSLRLLVPPEAGDRQAVFMQQQQIAADHSALLLLGDFPHLAGYLEDRRKTLPVLRLCSTPDDELVAALLTNPEDEVRLALKHLYDLGHRRIAFLGGWLACPGIEAKIRAFRSFAFRHGLYFPEHYLALSGFTEYEEHLQATEGLMRLEDRPTAIICANDQIAAAVYVALRRLGVRIPQDLSVVGCDGTSAHERNPVLTTVDIRPQEYARRALELLADAWQNPDFWRHSERIAPRLLVGASCAAPVAG